MSLSLTSIDAIGATAALKQILIAWKSALETAINAKAASATAPKLFSGTGAPTSVVPSKIGDLYVRTAGTVSLYFAHGVTEGDWTLTTS